MKYVSPRYHKAIQLHRSQGIRNQMHAKISFGLIDQYAFRDASITVSPGVSFSDPAGIKTGVNHVTDGYASWEQNFWQLNGKQKFVSPASPLDTGFISSVVSDGNGGFSSNPYLDVSFSTLHSMVGVTLQFDTVTGTAPLDFTVTAYQNGALKNTWLITGNTDVIYQGELGIEDADRIRIEFIKTRPYNRIRVNSLLFGIAYLFSGEDIISITHNRAASPVSLELPCETLTFTLFNKNRKYDLDSSFSLVPFLQQEQTVTLQYGYDVDGQGDVEWLEQERYRLESWDTDGITAQFTCKDIFHKLVSSTYEKGVFDKQSHTVADLAASVLTDAGVEDYWLTDVMLQTTGTNLPLLYDNHGSNLQLLANLGLSSLEQSSDGGVVFRYREEPDQSAMEARTWQAWQTAYSYYAARQSMSGGVFDQNDVPDYATWEEDFFALDGSMAFLPETSPYRNTGYVSDVFPKENGGYSESSIQLMPALTLNFGKNITFGELEVDMGGTSRLTAFHIIGEREISPAGAEHPVYETVFSKDNVPVLWENGKFYLRENFDRVAKVNLACVSNEKHQRGRIKRIKVNYTMPFSLEASDIIGDVKSEMLPRCSQVTLNTTRVSSISSLPSEPVQTVSVAPNVLTQVKHTKAYYDCQFQCDAPGAVIQQEAHYAFVSYLKITGVSQNADVKLYANTYSSESTVPYTKKINPVGDPVVIDNPLFPANSEHAADAVDWLSDYLLKRYEYTAETLGYPEVDPGDLITFRGKEATVLEANINFNQGAMRETFVLRGEEKLNGVANSEN